MLGGVCSAGKADGRGAASPLYKEKGCRAAGNVGVDLTVAGRRRFRGANGDSGAAARVIPGA
ncbi:hypothetical protein M2272_000826 [Mycobacterium frederiksbergense]|uniref:Uncharacterized protein n=1 Tax=Mycolicibacterium frederiksbergense TaxID=117567 RepID=A0ABT6KU10_9MYCO|nr:hypothetical protein [Mycolicibacterium frederiksbergense]